MKNGMIAQRLEDVDQVLDISGLTDENFDAYYTDVSEARGEDVTARISRKLKRSKSKNLKILLAGFKGTGKTTELKRLERELKGDYHIISISALEKLGGENATVAEFPIHMMRELIYWFGARKKFGQAIEIEFGKFIKSLAGHVLDLKLEGDTDIDIESHLNQLVNDSTINSKFKEFARDNSQSLVHSSLLCFDLILEEFYERNGADKVLFIIDDIEKINSKVAEDILYNYINKFAGRDCSYVFTIPMPLYERIVAEKKITEFDDNHQLSMLKTHEKNCYDFPKGNQCLSDLVHKRISGELIPGTLLEQFIRLSGGVIGDLFRLLKAAVDNALDRSAAKIDTGDYDYALEKIKSEYDGVIVYNRESKITRKQYYKLLVECFNSEDKKPFNEKGMLDLKLNNTLLGYEADSWFDVHPIVQQILDEENLIGINSTTDVPIPSITLKRLTLQNIRCFKDATIEFPTKEAPRPWSVLVGENGVGKSTILHCIALCSLGPDLLLQLVPIPQDMLRVGTAEGFMEAVFDVEMETTDGGDPSNEVTIHLTIEKGNRTFGIKFPENEAKRIQVRNFLNSRRDTSFEGWFVAAYGPVRNLRVMEDLSTHMKQFPIIDRVDSLFDPSDPLMDPASINNFLTGDTAIFSGLGAPDKLPPSIVQYIRDLLDKLLPEIYTKNPDGKGNLGTPFGHVPIAGLSEGYKSMLSWLAHLLMHMLAAVKWEGNINNIKGIVLIDEVDLHLHPRWQRKVIPTLKKSFSNMQFICCTHAPMTAGGAGDGDIILLKQENDVIRIPQDLPSIKGWRADQILTSLLFGLEATRDTETEKKLKDYTDLLGKKNPTEEDKTQLREWEEKLGDLIPVTMETPLEKEVYKLIMSTLKERIAKQKKEQKEELEIEKLDTEKMDNEVKRQIKRALK